MMQYMVHTEDGKIWSTRLPEDLIANIKSMAALERKSAQQLVREIIQQAVDKKAKAKRVRS